MKAGEVMTRNVATLPECGTLADAAKLMWDRNCGILPVVGEPEGRITGVVTDRDVCMGALTQGVPLHMIPVTMSMSHEVATCLESDDLLAVEESMRQRRVRRLPVIDGERHVIGIISLDDLARVALEAGGGKAATELKKELAKTLGVVAQPEPIEALRQMAATT